MGTSLVHPSKKNRLKRVFTVKLVGSKSVTKAGLSLACTIGTLTFAAEMRESAPRVRLSDKNSSTVNTAALGTVDVTEHGRLRLNNSYDPAPQRGSTSGKYITTPRHVSLPMGRNDCAFMSFRSRLVLSTTTSCGNPVTVCDGD